MNGYLFIDKPAQWTSQDVVAKLRGVYHTKHIGHVGTLDPIATGMLPVFVGRATRAIPYFEGADKCYSATMRLGVTTDTYDGTGQILAHRDVPVWDHMFDRVDALLDEFRGEIWQTPPMYSAVKINGQPLYKLARKGIEVERKARKVTIYSLTLMSVLPPEITMQVHCSKGTYIRSLCNDFGEAIGCGGIMTGLRRTAVGEHRLNEAVALQNVLLDADPARFLRPVDTLFPELACVKLSPKQEQLCRNGTSFPFAAPDGRYRVYSVRTGEFLMLGRVAGNVMSTERSFFEP